MKFAQLNRNWFPEPNNPELDLLETDEGLDLSFLLDAERFEHIDTGEKGIISFSNVYAYSSELIDEEEYKDGNFRYKHKQLPWGAFYELKDSGWEKNFPADAVMLNEDLNKKKMRHFIIFFNEELVECIAAEYKFTFEDTVSALLEEKYPKGYLNHFLAMFTSIFDTASIDNYRTYIDLYLQMEGAKEFTDMKAEIKNIQSNNDLPLYLKLANYSGIENFGMNQLNEMLKEIQAFKLH